MVYREWSPGTDEADPSLESRMFASLVIMTSLITGLFGIYKTEKTRR